MASEENPSLLAGAVPDGTSPPPTPAAPPQAPACGINQDDDYPDEVEPNYPEFIPDLSPEQEKALAALAAGKTAVEAAAIARVSRMTIYRWQHERREFTSALNICRQQTHDVFARRLTGMNEAALSALSRLLEKGDFRAVKLVISFIEEQRDTLREFREADETFNREERKFKIEAFSRMNGYLPAKKKPANSPP